jgi:two-component system chemotaxis response regulator CheB
MPDEIRVLIAEDSPTVRQQLKTVINTDSGFRVVGEARDGAEAFALVQQLRPDVVTMDIQMPLVDGLAATRQIMAACPTPVVIVSGVVDDRSNSRSTRWKAGRWPSCPSCLIGHGQTSRSAANSSCRRCGR